jgi:glyoxylase-like metal-dependent hydrolase (beta-lactamase superfamily II)
MVDILTINCGFVNCYLLKNGESAVLVDTGLKGGEQRVIAAMAQYGVAPESLKMIVITHGHADHAGGCAYIRERYKAKVGINPKDITVTKKLKGDTAMGGAMAFFMNLAKPVTVVPDIELADGMRLDAYGIPAKIVGLPGHTDGSVAILLDDGRFVAGDVFFNFGKPTLPHIAVDFDALYRNRERLNGLGIATVYPGHGKPFAFSGI